MYTELFKEDKEYAKVAGMPKYPPIMSVKPQCKDGVPASSRMRHEQGYGSGGWQPPQATGLK
eukprot:4433360-Karenia_brevis.AAC.1